MDLFQILIERDNSLLTCLLGIADNFLDDGLAVFSSLEENPRQAPKSSQDGRKGKLQHDGPNGSSQDNHRCSGLKDLAEVSAFQKQTRQDPAYRKSNSADTGFVHAPISSPSQLPTPSDGVSALSGPRTKVPAAASARRRKFRISSSTCATVSSTTIFSPVTSVRTVSGVFSMNLIMSELTTSGRLLSLVSRIMLSTPGTAPPGSGCAWPREDSFFDSAEFLSAYHTTRIPSNILSANRQATFIPRREHHSARIPGCSKSAEIPALCIPETSPCPLGKAFVFDCPNNLWPRKCREAYRYFASCARNNGTGCKSCRVCRDQGVNRNSAAWGRKW